MVRVSLVGSGQGWVVRSFRVMIRAGSSGSGFGSANLVKNSGHMVTYM